MIEATQNHVPAMGAPQKSKPSKQAARPLVMLLEIVWMVALAAVLCWKFVPNIEEFMPKSDRRGAAIEEAEQAAAQTLRARKVLVIEEGPGHAAEVSWAIRLKNEPRVPAVEQAKPPAASTGRDPAVAADKRVTSVNFCGASVFGDKPLDDDLLAELRHFTDLQSLNVGDCKITGEQLKYLDGLPKMASLVLSNTKIDDRGLDNLASLDAIESLNLRDTAISDDGLDYLSQPRVPYGTLLCLVAVVAAGILGFSRVYVPARGIAKISFFVLVVLLAVSLPTGGLPRPPLQNLKVLDLSKTKITDAGVKKLLPLKNLKWLLLAETSISDAGLDQLAPLTELGRLTLNKTKVTPAGIARLKRSIPKIQVDNDFGNAPAPPQGSPPSNPAGHQPPAAAAAGDRPASVAGHDEAK